jgi:carboxypeptidase T
MHFMARLFSILILTFSISIFAHEDHHSLLHAEWTMLAKIKVDHYHDGLKFLSENDMDIAGVDIDNNEVDVLLNDYQYRFLIDAGYQLEISETKGVTKRPDADYQTPAKIENLLKKYHTQYPNLTKLVSIGKSLEGLDIWAIKISDDASVDDLDEPVVLFNSMHHAREIMTPEISIDIIDYLLKNYNRLSQVKNWVDNTAIWVIPMFNVDGNNKMWKSDSMWRKNTRGGYGVDLNRNYPTGWDSCNGSSGSRHSQTYRGESPASEPETQVMMNFIAEKRPVFDISYHSYSELVIYPYGCGKLRTQTKEVVETIGKRMANLINYKPGTAWELLYNADGGDIDWMYEAYQVIPYVLEVNSTKEGFHPSYKKWRDVTVERNRPAWQYLLDRVQKSGVRGQVFDKAMMPLGTFSLKVFKKENNSRAFFQDYKGQKSGVYHLVLNPGEYEIEVYDQNKLLVSHDVIIGDELVNTNIQL